MQTKNLTEYRDLATESSNLMIEADSKWVLGNYPLAAYYFLQAGRKRSQMGQISFDDAQFANAAADWLSATACFLQGTSIEHAQTTMKLVYELERDEKIPEDRLDIHVAIREREQELTNLEEKIDDFFAEFGERDETLDSVNQETLDFLLSQVRELPGLAILHYAIYNQAAGLNRTELAASHAEWAAKFDPENANYTANFGYQCLDMGDADRAEAVGRDFLKIDSSEATPVRIMLASALGSGHRSDGPERLEAIELLMPIVNSQDAPIPLRLSAMALCSLFHAELGDSTKATGLLNDIESLAKDIGDKATLENLDKFRQMLPKVLRQSENGMAASVQVEGRDELIVAFRSPVAA